MASRRRLLIIGNGMAASRLLDELVKRDVHRFAITVIGEETATGYNRILLSPFLAREKSLNDVITHNADWYQQHQIQLHSGDAVITIDSHNRTVLTASGKVFEWDHLVIATGARAARLNIPGSDLDQVMCLRTLDDARHMQTIALQGGKAVVIGGGLLGLEAAYGLHRLGMHVSVVHNGQWLMNRQLDNEAGALLEASLQKRGMTLYTEAISEAFIGDRQVCGLKLQNGTTIDCDLAVIGIGIAPEVSLARHAGLTCEQAIVTDHQLRTSMANVSALGECCQIDGELFGMVAPIYQQARILACRLMAEESEGYHREALPTRLKVSGIDVFSAGDLSNLEDCRTLAWRDPQRGHYRRLWLRQGRLVAAVMFGDVDDGGLYFDLIQEGRRIPDPAALLLGMAEAA